MSLLEKILSRTRADLEERRTRIALDDLRARCRDQRPVRDFLGAVHRERVAGGAAGVPPPSQRRGGRIRVIAEVKRASPSKGVIRPDFDPVALAVAYADAGADALSVLTDAPFFQGSLEQLTTVRSRVGLPILRKDFHVDPYQIWEARAAGADAVLLIVAAQAPSALVELLGVSRELGLTALVEAHTAGELETALQSGARLVGINNRDLKTFEVSLETTFALLPRVPAGVVLLSESGISRTEEVARLAGAGVDGILVGEGLLRHADVGRALRNLVGSA